MKKTLLAAAILIMTIFGYVERDYAAILNWDKNPDASTYSVYVRDSGGTNTDYRLVQSGITGVSITVVPAIHNHDYEYAVKAFNECGNSSDYSDPVKYNDCLSQIIQKNNRVENINYIIGIRGKRAMSYESTPEFIKGNRAKAIALGLDLGALANMTDDEAAHYANGCGPSPNGTKNIFSRIISETEFALIPAHSIDGTDFTPACIIHDCDYEVGKTDQDKSLADLRLHANIRKIIKATSPHLIRDFDYFMADIFYEAVDHFGKSAFLNNDPVING